MNKRMNIQISNERYKKIKIAAIEMETTVGELITKAVDKLLMEYKIMNEESEQ